MRCDDYGVKRLVIQNVRIGECPSDSPFLRNNVAEAPKVSRLIVFKDWRDTEDILQLKIHTLYFINLINY